MVADETRSPEEVRQERKVQVALGYRLLAAQRWGDLGDGHISARDPERSDCFWMLRLGVSYHQATVKDLVLVGPDGHLEEGEGIINMRIPSASGTCGNTNPASPLAISGQ